MKIIIALAKKNVMYGKKNVSLQIDKTWLFPLNGMGLTVALPCMTRSYEGKEEPLLYVGKECFSMRERVCECLLQKELLGCEDEES